MSLFAKTKSWLRRKYPLPYRISIRLVAPTSLPGAYGTFFWDGNRGSIHLRSTLSEEHASETLLEEYAHALRQSLAVPVDYDGEPHDAHFWLVYGALVSEWRKTHL